MIRLASTLSQLHKSDGTVNVDAGTFTDDAIVGPYQQVPAPDNWRHILIDASRHTHNMTALTNDDLGDGSKVENGPTLPATGIIFSNLQKRQEASWLIKITLERTTGSSPPPSLGRVSWEPLRK